MVSLRSTDRLIAIVPAGTETPGVTLYAFEPDPRNRQPPPANVRLYSAAVGDCDGTQTFYLSGQKAGQDWTCSSSLKRPKNHLRRYSVTFGETVQVQTVRLDSFCRRQGIESIDFLWADIQGAEGEMIRGGRRALSNTRYLFTEYSDDELYEGQISLAGILGMLPDFRVVELWAENVLLENRALVK